MADWPADFLNGVRIDCGPQVRTIVASKKAFESGKLASHYAVGARDALGKEIVDGKKFHYVDWKAPPEEFVFTVYQMRDGNGNPASSEFDGDGNHIARYEIIERFATEAEAEAAARKLAGAK